MHCPNCGQESQEGAQFCLKCGKQVSGPVKCPSCGKEVPPEALFCPDCGRPIGIQRGNASQGTSTLGEAKSRLAAGLLGVFVGGLGIHRFYLGYVGIGIAQIIVTICTCGLGHIWGFIEGILLLVGSINKDAQGKPLKE